MESPAEPQRQAAQLDVAVLALVQRLWTRSPGWWTEPRRRAARELIEGLDEVARAHGAGPPDRLGMTTPPELDDHALADQIAVLAAEVTRVETQAVVAASVEALALVTAAMPVLA